MANGTEEEKIASSIAEGMTGGQKAAILLIALGPEISAEVYKFLNDPQIRQLTREIAGLKQVTKEIQTFSNVLFVLKTMILKVLMKSLWARLKIKRKNCYGMEAETKTGGVFSNRD